MSHARINVYGQTPTSHHGDPRSPRHAHAHTHHMDDAFSASPSSASSSTSASSASDGRASLEDNYRQPMDEYRDEPDFHPRVAAMTGGAGGSRGFSSNLNKTVPSSSRPVSTSTPQSKYPTQHSFVVDMNNEPLYEHKRREQREEERQQRAAELAARKNVATMQPESLEGAALKYKVPEEKDVNKPPISEGYYPPKSYDQGDESKRRCTWGYKMAIALLLLLFAVIFFGAILGTAVEIHELVKEQKAALEELKETIARGCRDGVMKE